MRCQLCVEEARVLLRIVFLQTNKHSTSALYSPVYSVGVTGPFLTFVIVIKQINKKRGQNQRVIHAMPPMQCKQDATRWLSSHHFVEICSLYIYINSFTQPCLHSLLSKYNVCSSRFIFLVQTESITWPLTPRSSLSSNLPLLASIKSGILILISDLCLIVYVILIVVCLQ